MRELKHRQFLRDKEAQQILKDFTEKTKISIRQLFDSKDLNLEIAETTDAIIYFINDKPLIAKYKNTLTPTLLFDKALQTLPKIIVNMGAVPHICNGADLMAPGIVKIESNFQPDDYVVIVDEQHQKPLAIATAVTDSETARTLAHGKIAKNLHYVSDIIWNQIKKS